MSDVNCLSPQLFHENLIHFLLQLLCSGFEFGDSFLDVGGLQRRLLQQLVEAVQVCLHRFPKGCGAGFRLGVEGFLVDAVGAAGGFP